MANRNKLHSLYRDIETIQFLCGGNAVDEVVGAVVILDLAETLRGDFPIGLTLDAHLNL